MEKIAIERDIWIAAPCERVWRAITDPRQIAQWFSPGTEFQSSGEGVGARIYVQSGDAELYVQVIEVYEPPYRVAMRSVDTANVVMWTLAEENGGTRVIVRETGFEWLSGDARQERMDQDAAGFGMALENLQAHVEGRSLPYPGGF